MSTPDNLFTPNLLSSEGEDPGGAGSSAPIESPLSPDECAWDDDAGDESVVAGGDHSPVGDDVSDQSRPDLPLTENGEETQPARKGNDDILVDALARGFSQKEAARKANMSPRTVSRRLKEEPQLRQRVSEHKANLAAESAQELRQLGDLAREAQARAMSRAMELVGSEDPKVALDAIRSIFQGGPRIHQGLAVEHRVVELEARADQAEANPPAAPGARWPEC